MTRKEELLYLLDLQAEAFKWQVEEPDNRYELEVKERITTIVNELTDPSVKPKESKSDSNAKYRETHVKIREHGKEMWIYKEDAERVVDPNTGRERWQRKQKQHPLQDAIFDIDKD